GGRPLGRGRLRRKNILDRYAVACVGLRARVVYSRQFPDQTRPQTGRLNKSPHTVYAFAKPYSGQNDDQSQGSVRGGNVSAESFRRNLSPARRTADCALDFRYSHNMACRNPIRPDFIGFWRLAWRSGGGGALWRRHCYCCTAAETAVGNPLGLPPKHLWHCEKLRLQRHLQSFRMLKGKSVDVSTAGESSRFLRPRRAQAAQSSSSGACFRHCRQRARGGLCRQRAYQSLAAAFEPAANRQSAERE